MKTQRVKEDNRIAADCVRVTLRYGPLSYKPKEWIKVWIVSSAPRVRCPCDGVMVILGRFADSTPSLASLNYARLNRAGRSIVWMLEQ